jgi:hypothetical protein
MTRVAISPAASALLRALAARAGVPRDRIVLIEVRSTDWQSLTFAGERHHFELRIHRPGSGEVARRMCDGIADAEFSIPGLLVADIALDGAPPTAPDGSTDLIIEALTIAAD